jgi:hypothetical protein
MSERWRAWVRLGTRLLPRLGPAAASIKTELHARLRRRSVLVSALAALVVALVLASDGRLQPLQPLAPPAARLGLPELGSETAYVTGDPDLDAVQEWFLPTLVANHRHFRGRSGMVRGFGAGDIYPQIWLRDSATVLPLARYYFGREELTSWIEEHLAAQRADGSLFDWVASGRPDAFRKWAPLARELPSPGGAPLSADKNTTESDQEASAVRAVCVAFQAVRDPAWLRRSIQGKSVLERTSAALEYVLAARRDRVSGLIFGALTADWGDLSPAYPDQRAIYLDARTPRATGLYATAIVALAAGDLASLYSALGDPRRAYRLRVEAARLRAAIDRHLWQTQQGFYRMHRLLTPHLARGFPRDEDTFALGGHALALLAGAGDDEQVRRVIQTVERRRREQGLTTIAASLLPPYPAGAFPHPAMTGEWQYQNGGQWTWLAGRFVRAEFERGHSKEAGEHLRGLARSARASGGFYEWSDRGGRGRGSAHYAGSAAALGDAVLHGLFGVALMADRLDVRLRLGGSSGQLALLEPASGRALAIAQTHSSKERLVVEYVGRGVDAGTLSVRLPEHVLVRSVTLDQRAAPFGMETVGEDTFVSLATDWNRHRLGLELEPGRGGAIR